MRWPHSAPRHRGRRTALLAVMASVTAVGAVACTGDTTDDAAPSPRTTVELAWTANLDPVSGVTMVGDTAVVYATTPDGLTLNGLDPTTGAVRWTQAAAPLADGTSFLDVGIVDGGRSVAYFRPGGQARQAQLVVAEATTGADVTVSPARWWGGPPTTCRTDSTAVCAGLLVRTPNDSWQVRTARLDPASRELGPDIGNTLPANAMTTALRDIGLYSLWMGDHVEVGRSENGASVWQQPLSSLLGPEVAAAQQWWITDLHRSDLWGLSALDVQDRVDLKTDLDLATDVAAAAFDQRDGVVAWRSQGRDFLCGHADLPRLDGGDVLTCRYTGHAHRSDGADGVLAADDLDVTLERTDPATGQTRWQTAVGAADVLLDARASEPTIARVGDDHIVVPRRSGGPMTIDLNDGSTNPVPAEQTMWCGVSSTYPMDDARYVNGVPVRTAPRFSAHQRCAADGSPTTDESAPTSIPMSIGTRLAGSDGLEDIQIVSESNAVRAYKVPPPGTQASPTATSSSDSSSASASATPSVLASSSETDPPGAAWPTSVAEAWSSDEIRPVSEVRIVGGTAVYYGLLHSDLFLVGLDPKTGEEKWRREATTGGLRWSTQLEVTVAADRIVSLRPQADPSRLVSDVSLAMTDPVSGDDVVVTEPRRWWTQPSPCDDDSNFVCSTTQTGIKNLNAGTEDVRVSAVTGEIASASADVDRPYRVLAGRLVEVTGQAVPTIGLLDGEQVVWSRPLTEVAGEGAAIADLKLVDWTPGMVVLSLDRSSAQQDTAAGTTSSDMSVTFSTAALRLSDGSTAWQEPGTSLGCRNIVGPRFSANPGSDSDLRCRYTGTLSFDPSSGRESLSSDTVVSVEQYDPTSGKAIWSTAVGDASTLAINDGSHVLPALDDTRVAVNGQLLDLESGAIQPLVDVAYWCPGPRTFDQSVPYVYGDDGVTVTRLTNGLVTLCDARGAPLSARQPSAVPVTSSVTTIDGVRIVSLPDRVVAYEVPR